MKIHTLNGTKYSIMDQVKSVEDSLKNFTWSSWVLCPKCTGDFCKFRGVDETPTNIHDAELCNNS